MGRIARAHGVRGEVAVLALSQVASRFEPGSRLFLDRSPQRSLTVASSRPHHGRLLVRFEGIEDRTKADGLRGAYLFVPAGWSPQLPEGEFWPHQLVGCEVRTAAGRSIGRIREVIHTPANDVWATEGPDGETLVPALREVVEEVDLDARIVLVRDVPGLTAP